MATTSTGLAGARCDAPIGSGGADGAADARTDASLRSRPSRKGAGSSDSESEFAAANVLSMASGTGFPVVGELLALGNGGQLPLVRFDGQPGSSAIPARACVDLHGAHIGRSVVLLFEGGDPSKPIVMGVLGDRHCWPGSTVPPEVQVEADGARLVIAAADQLVLRCGQASITLTRAGKVLIKGSYLVSHSTGVNKIKGGAVELN